MEQVPAEILNDVFTHLHQDDQLNCMFVCRHWKQMIEQCVLYRTLHVYSNRIFDKLITKIRDNPIILHKVEKLVVENCDIAIVRRNAFLSRLQSIRKIIYIDQEHHKHHNEQVIGFQFHKSIECILDNSSKIVVHHLFATGTCPNLTTLSTLSLTSDTIPLLKNAPSLRSLSLSCASYSFADIDLIHENAPKLISIKLREISITSVALNMNINPTTSVTECIFLAMNIKSNLAGKSATEYIRTKYPNLTSLSCSFCYFGTPRNEIDVIQSSGIIPVIQNLGSQLKKLTLFSENSHSTTFDIMDCYGCKLDYLTLYSLSSSSLQSMIHSKQILSLQTLELSIDKFNTFDWLNNFQVLKDLKLSSLDFSPVRSTINMNDFLRNCPESLKSLSLKSFTPTNILGYTYQPLNIKNLCISYGQLPEGIDRFICKHFSKLSTLIIKKCDLVENRLNLRNIDLDNFQLHKCVLSGYINTLLIITTGNNEERMYHSAFRSRSDTILMCAGFPLPSLKSIPMHENNLRPQFTLICGSLKNI